MAGGKGGGVGKREAAERRKAERLARRARRMADKLGQAAAEARAVAEELESALSQLAAAARSGPSATSAAQASGWLLAEVSREDTVPPGGVALIPLDAGVRTGSSLSTFVTASDRSVRVTFTLRGPDGEENEEVRSQVLGELERTIGTLKTAALLVATCESNRPCDDRD